MRRRANFVRQARHGVTRAEMREADDGAEVAPIIGAGDDESLPTGFMTQSLTSRGEFMQTNFELALKTIESLSDEDYERLWHWMQERMQGKITQRSQSNSGVSPPLNENGWQERAAKFREAMRWIDEHRQQYLGQWVCLDGNKLVSHGTDGKQVYADAKKQGIKIPFVEQVREEEKSPFWGGWD